MNIAGASSRVGLMGALSLCILVSGCGGGDAGGEASDRIEVVDSGLQNPYAVVYDAAADLYLVSNVAGGPLDEDQNGFISQISPEGEVVALQWATNTPPTGLLNAPKGMAIRGDSVFVADIGCIRIRHRATGASEGQSCLEDVSSLSGVAVGPEGSIFVTDSGYEMADGQMAASQTDAVYRLVFNEERQGATLVRDPELGHPTGIDVGSRGIFVTTAEGTLMALTPNGERTDLISTPEVAYDGVVFLTDGSFAYSSSTNGSVRLVDSSGEVSIVADDLGAPGDLGYDSTRNRLIVTVPDENRLVFLDL